MNRRLQEHSSDYLLCQFKRQGKEDDGVNKVQSVLCENAVRLNRVVVV